MFVHFAAVCNCSKNNSNQTTLFELNWGKGQNEVSLVPEDADDLLTGIGPIDFAVDEKNNLIYIYDWANDYRILQCGFKGNVKKVITKEMYGKDSAIVFNVDKQGNLCVYSCDKKRKNKLLIFNSNCDLIRTIDLKINPVNTQEMYLDEKNRFWLGYSCSKTFEFNTNGEIISEFGSDKTNLVRSKGKYYTRTVSGNKYDNQNTSEVTYLCDISGNTISKLPASAVLIGIDAHSNCYLNIYEPSEKKDYIWICNSKGQTIKKHKLYFELHDQNAFLQIRIADSGNIYIAPNSNANNRFRIIKIDGLRK